MNKIIENKAFLFGDNIDTDQIYPGRYLELTDPKEIACHTMEGIENGFQERFIEGGIIIAGRNFGCGSSREHAPIALTALGTSLVIADSFARIFFRNAINLGLPLMVCKGIHDNCNEGDQLNINLTTGEIENISTGKKMQGEPFSEYVMEILESGGIKPLLRKQISQ